MSVFNFLAGLGLIAAGRTVGAVQDRDLKAKNREWNSYNYSHLIQSKYDESHRYLSEFDYRKMIDAVKSDYPNMSDYFAHHLVKIAVAKRLMEEETAYDYFVPDNIKNAEIDYMKYATDEFKLNKEV